MSSGAIAIVAENSKIGFWETFLGQPFVQLTRLWLIWLPSHRVNVVDAKKFWYGHTAVSPFMGTMTKSAISKKNTHFQTFSGFSIPSSFLYFKCFSQTYPSGFPFFRILLLIRVIMLTTPLLVSFNFGGVFTHPLVEFLSTQFAFFLVMFSVSLAIFPLLLCRCHNYIVAYK